MKNQQIDITFHYDPIKQLKQFESIQFQEIKEIKQIKCIKGNRSINVCLNKSCKKYAFICLDESCQCMKQHQKCLSIYVKNLKKSLNEKMVPLDDFLKQICQKIDQAINELSNFRQELQRKVKTDFTHHGLSEKQMLLVNALQTATVQKITGEQIWQAVMNIQNKPKIISATEDFQKQIFQIWNKLYQQTKKCTNEIQEKLKMFKTAFFESTILNQKQIFGSIFKDSKLFSSKQQKQKLCKFFQKSKIKTSKLLYRTSENDFDKNKFHAKCDNIANTLTICQTQFGKIIGGYTPLTWNSSDQARNDQAGNSFIFSLTNNHKFKLQTGKTAITQYSNLGPTFGNGDPDFYINNQTNIRASYAKICQSYINQNYKQGQKQSWQRFSGSSKDYSFKTKEWQVWHLQFNS